MGDRSLRVQVDKVLLSAILREFRVTAPFHNFLQLFLYRLKVSRLDEGTPREVGYLLLNAFDFPVC